MERVILRTLKKRVVHCVWFFDLIFKASCTLDEKNNVRNTVIFDVYFTCIWFVHISFKVHCALDGNNRLKIL